MTEQMTSPRHATWLELFFDLVVVAAEHATEPLPNLHRWLLCAALALCLALCAIANRAWWGLLILAAPLALAAFGSGVSAVFSVLVLAAAVGGFVLLFNRRPAVEA